MEKLIVNKKYENKKVKNFLQDNISILSDNLFYKLLRKKDIKINGKRINKNVNLKLNDEVVIYISDKIMSETVKIEIVFEDENILIINKPINIETTGENSLTQFVQKKYCDLEFLPMPCHRLDRNTRGLILFAKNKKSLNILKDKFKNHEIEKRYLAWVYGIPKKDSQLLEDYLFKDRKKSIVYISNKPKKGYVKISTLYTVVEKYDDTSLLEIELKTGRTHQIRAHLAYVGLPIIGDGKYGEYDINKKFNCNTQNLISYKLKFNFKTDADILNYLNQKEFSIENINVEERKKLCK